MYSIEDLTIRVGNSKIVLNKRLLDSQNAWDNLTKIKELHAERLKIIISMKATKEDDTKPLREMAKEITELDFKLQEQWGFGRNANFHRFWELPHCKCPHLDNTDMYGTGYSYTNASCPIHGGEK